MKIKLKVWDIQNVPVIMKIGDWIDLRANETVKFELPKGSGTDSNVDAYVFRYIPLGVAMKLPKGFEALVLPRSSTFKNFNVLQANSMGVIDETYCGNNDQWHFPCLALKDTVIQKGERICQFRIQLSQKATFWQKLRWFFSSKIEFDIVKDLESEDRGGLGSTGTK